MKKLIIALSFGAMVASCSIQREAVTYTQPKTVDVVVTKGMTVTTFKGVELLDQQEDFCMFIENGVTRIQKAPYEIICNK